MARRRQAAISLFAFQDIITSVSGVVIVIVLLLTLELVERPQPAEAPVSDDAVSQLEQRLAELRELREQLAAGEAAGDIVALAARSPERLSRDLQEAQQFRDGLAAELAELEQQLELSRERGSKLEDQLKAAMPQRREIESLKARLADVQSRLRATIADNRLVFILPPGVRRDGWLAVLGSDEISVAPLGRPAAPISFRSRRGILTTSAAAQFADWARSQKTSSFYMLLLVRPSGVREFDTADALLSKAGIQYGFDLITEEQQVLDAQKGAAW